MSGGSCTLSIDVLVYTVCTPFLCLSSLPSPPSLLSLPSPSFLSLLSLSSLPPPLTSCLPFSFSPFLPSSLSLLSPSLLSLPSPSPPSPLSSLSLPSLPLSLYKDHPSEAWGDVLQLCLGPYTHRTIEASTMGLLPSDACSPCGSVLWPRTQCWPNGQVLCDCLQRTQYENVRL